MANLVIHPADPTTDFLIEGYCDTDYNVINTNCSKSQLKRYIKDHNRIIMFGHGSHNGLFGFKNRMVIDSTIVFLLRSKIESIFVWCNADQFVRKYGLKGFATGMIISEYREALDYAVRATDQEIEESNILFANAIKESIHLPIAEVRNKILEIYKSDDNPVIFFNRQNLFIFE